MIDPVLWGVEVEYELWDVATARARQDELWAIYETVCAQHEDQMVWHESMLGKHMRRARFRLAAAVGPDGTVAGFGWGYTGHEGQWWSDRVAEVLAPCLAARWVGGHFEVVELAVPDQPERSAILVHLHDRLLTGMPEQRALVSVDDQDREIRDVLVGRGWHPLGKLTRGWTIYGAHAEHLVPGALF